MLNSGANTNLFGNKALLATASEPIFVNGLGERIKMTVVGDLEGFGRVYYCLECPVNVLSLDQVTQWCPLTLCVEMMTRSILTRACRAQQAVC
jgi:hypothetical protein